MRRARGRRCAERAALRLPARAAWYWDPVDEVRADGADTVLFTLHHPYARLPSLLWGTHTTVCNQALRAERPDDFGYRIADGTGPFKLESWSPERIMTSRFDGYHGRRPLVDGIEWRAILDEQARLDALKSGAVHVLHGPPMREVDRLHDDPRFDVVEFPQASTFYLGLDWKRTDLGFDDVRVRRAVSLAIDRQAIVAAALNGRGSPVWGPLPPGDEHYDPSVDAEGTHDPRQAIELLRAARGEQPIEVDCLAQDDVVFRRIAPLLQQQLSAVGITMTFHYEQPFLPFYAACGAGPSAFVSKWLWPDAVDAVIGFSSTRCDGFPNFQHSSIPALDDAFGEWLRAGSDPALHAAARRVQSVAAEQLPYIPLVTPNDVWVSTKRLRGFRAHPADLYPRYDEIALEDDGAPQ